MRTCPPKSETAIPIAIVHQPSPYLKDCEWIDPEPFAAFERIRVPPQEPFGANVLRLETTICLPSGMPRTREMVMQRGYCTDVTDISEFMKAEAGLTCMSLVFDPSPLA